MLNSLWGMFVMRESFSKTNICNSSAENKKSGKSRKGASSKAKNQDKFRQRKGKQEMSENKSRIESNLSMLSKDKDNKLKQLLENVRLNP